MNPELISAILKGLPIETLGKIVKLLEAELQSRAPAAPIDTSYDALVQRFGVDGNAQLKLASAGHHKITPQTVELDTAERPYLLGDLPFVTNFDQDLVAFVYEPTGKIKRKFAKAMSQDFIPHAMRLQVVGAFEILIDPELGRSSRINVRNIDSGVIIPMTETLEQFIEWYNREDRHGLFEQAPFYPKPFGNFSLIEFEGRSVVRDIEWEGLVFKTAPYRTGNTFNVNTLSNLDQLIEAGEVPNTALLERNPTITSVYVKVGNHLIRVMTQDLPYSRFVPSHLPNDFSSRLDLRVAINITPNMEDAFGEVIPWTKLLSNEGLDLEIGLHGSFTSETGIMNLGKGSAKFFVHDELGDLLTQLLTDRTEVLAVSVDGAIVER